MVEKPVQVLFKGDALHKLEELKDASDAPSTSQVIRNALKVLAALQNLKDDDGYVTILKDGNNYKILLP